MKNIKKTLTAIGLLCFGMTQGFAATADNNNKMSGSCKPDCKPACPPKDCRDCVDTQMSMKTGVPPAEYNMDCPMFTVGAAYTYWAARQESLISAMSNYYAYPGSSAPASGSIYRPSFTSQSGFKVFVGTTLGHDNWDSMLQYTWFYNNNNGLNNLNVAAGSTLAIYPIDPYYGEPGVVETAFAQWNNWFNRIDWQLARSFYAGHYLTLRPFLGLVGAWDKQKFNNAYQTTSDVTKGILQNNYQTQSWWGVGPYAGLSSNFMFYVTNCNHFSLFMDTGAAMAWGVFQPSLQAVFGNGDTCTIASNSYSSLSPMLELAFGARWESWWQDNAYMFLLQAAWETQVWFGHNQFLQGTTMGNYSMQGLTLKAGFGF